jgi:hypothetical protein
MKYFKITIFIILFLASCKTPSEPQKEREFKLITEYHLSGYAQGLFLEDSLLFVADGQGGLVILDISYLPDSMKFISQKETGYNAVSVCVKDSFAFIGFNDVNRKGIWVYKISDLSNPEWITGDEGLAYAYDVWLPSQDTNYLYIASGYWYYIEDLSGLPYYLSFAKRYHPPGKARGIFADSNYVYLACEQMGVVIYPALVPEVPDSEAIVSWMDTPNNARDLVVKNNKIFVADGYGGLVIIDIIDIENPFIISSIDLSGYAQKLEVDGNKVYIACGNEGVFGIDLSDVYNPEIFAVFKASYIYDVKVNEDYIFVADRDRGIIVLSKEIE